MNKTAAGALVAIIAVGLIGGMAYSNKDKNQSSQSSTSMDAGHDSSMKTADSSSSANSNEVKSGEVSLDIKGFEFQPEKIKVKPGTTVTWTNRDDARHDVAPDTESPDFPGSGKLLAEGETYSFKFEKAGTYPYHCTPHHYMKATVEVVES